MRPPLDLMETGGGLKVQTTTPHLVGLGSGRLSVAITLMPLNEGVTRIGREDASVPQDITIEGLGIEAEHCRIINSGGVITLDPAGNLCSLDGVHVSKPTLLTQDTFPHLLAGASPIPRYTDKKAYKCMSVDIDMLRRSHLPSSSLTSSMNIP